MIWHYAALQNYCLTSCTLRNGEVNYKYGLMLLYIKNQPEVVHVAHLVVEHREEAKKEVKSDDVGKVEGYVPAVWE